VAAGSAKAIPIAGPPKDYDFGTFLKLAAT
jgi:hypothetical protein